MISTPDDDVLLNATLKKYSAIDKSGKKTGQQKIPKEKAIQQGQNKRWIVYLCIIIILIVWQILKRR